MTEASHTGKFISGNLPNDVFKMQGKVWGFKLGPEKVSEEQFRVKKKKKVSF